MTQAKTQGRIAKGDGRVQARKLVDLVQREVEDGATSVEEVHKAIANLPLEVLERLDLFRETARNVRKIQDTSIGAVYDVIRKIDREVARLASEVLRRSAKARPRPKAARSKVTRISATA